MRLCDISSLYSQRGGGVRTYHVQKLGYFERHPEHRYAMIVSGPCNTVDDVPGGRVYRVRGLPVTRDGIYRQIIDPLEVRRILRLERPDVIEVGSAYLDGWLALAGGSGLDAVTVGFYHADFPDSYIAPALSGIPPCLSRPLVGFVRGYVRFVYGRFDATCVTSRYIERKLARFGLGNTHRIPLGVDVLRFHPSRRDPRLRRDLGLEDGDLLLVFVGRLGSEKGVDVLLDAIRWIGGRPGLFLAVVGDGSHGPLVREAAAPHENVRVAGYEEDPDRLATLYATADLFLSPGAHETFGLATLEAMSSGLPVIAASSGGAAELVTASGGGRLFRAHDGADLVRLIGEVILSDRAAMGVRARRHVVDNLSWDRTFDAMVDLYSRLAPGRGSSRRATGLPVASTSPPPMV